MKKVLYIYQYFKVPSQGGGTRSYWFSKELLLKGCEVVMLTSRGQQNKLIERELVEGINVIYIKNEYDNSFGILRRAWSFIRFMLLSTIVALQEKNVDIVFATSTPLTVGIPALFLKWFKRKKYIFEVRDLWPEVLIQLGGVKNKAIISILRYIERTIYKNATHIIALSPGMKQGVLDCGIKEEKVSLIPNMSKIDRFYRREKNTEMMKRFNLSEDEFYVIHFGAMGIANGLDYIIDAAKILQDNGNKKIKFLFAGRGGQEKVMKQRLNKENINNVMFLGQFGMDEISELVNISNCSITSFSNYPILRTNSPNKLFDSLSAQKPIIVNSAGWTKDMVEKNRCGAFVDPANPKELVDLLIAWEKDNLLIEQMGLNSRKLAEEVYDKSILTKDFSSLLCSFI